MEQCPWAFRPIQGYCCYFGSKKFHFPSAFKHNYLWLVATRRLRVRKCTPSQNYQWLVEKLQTLDRCRMVKLISQTFQSQIVANLDRKKKIIQKNQQNCIFAPFFYQFVCLFKVKYVLLWYLFCYNYWEVWLITEEKTFQS